MRLVGGGVLEGSLQHLSEQIVTVLRAPAGGGLPHRSCNGRERGQRRLSQHSSAGARSGPSLWQSSRRLVIPRLRPGCEL